MISNAHDYEYSYWTTWRLSTGDGLGHLMKSQKECRISKMDGQAIIGWAGSSGAKEMKARGDDGVRRLDVI